MHDLMDKGVSARVALDAMITNFILPLCAVLASATLSLGCIATEGDTESESVATTEEAVIANNGWTNNGLTSSALTSSTLTSKALTSNALTARDLTDNALTSRALKDPL